MVTSSFVAGVLAIGFSSFGETGVSCLSEVFIVMQRTIVDVPMRYTFERIETSIHVHSFTRRRFQLIRVLISLPYAICLYVSTARRTAYLMKISMCGYADGTSFLNDCHTSVASTATAADRFSCDVVSRLIEIVFRALLLVQPTV